MRAWMYVHDLHGHAHVQVFGMLTLLAPGFDFQGVGTTFSCTFPSCWLDSIGLPQANELGQCKHHWD